MRNVLRGPIGASLLLLVFAATARAQVCETSCSRYEEGECVEHSQTCTEAPSVPAVSFGAIAYGRTSGAFGFSYQWGSRTKAVSVAIANCSQHGKDCEMMVWFDRRCGAVAVDKNGGHATWGLGRSYSEARTASLSKCSKDSGGKPCAVKVSQCSL